jgi:hypothetical protein
LAQGGTYPRFAPTGHVVFAANGTLQAVRYDLLHRATVGKPVSIVEGVGMAQNGVAHYDVSSNGALAYLPGPVGNAIGRVTLGWFARDGASELLKVPPGSYEMPRLSPDGRRIAYGSVDREAATIWVYDVSGATAAQRLTFDGQGHNRFPVWSADSQQVTFQSDRDRDAGVFSQRADGTGTAERLLKAEEGMSYIPEAWSPDGRHLLYAALSRNDVVTLWVWPAKEKKAEPFAEVISPYTTGTSGTLPGAVFSPNGRWIAYAAREGRARSVVYVQPFPPTGARYQVSRNDDDGHHPVWSPDGKELFFTPLPGRLVGVRISDQPTFGVGESIELSHAYVTAAPWFERPYDISRDGKRFLGLIDAVQTDRAEAAQRPQIRVVLNWGEELKRLAPPK